MTHADADVEPVSPPRHRWLRRIGLGAVALLGIVVALVALLQLPPVATAVVRKLLTLAPLNPGHRLEVGRASGTFLSGLTLEDVRLLQDGRVLAHIDRLTAGYRLSGLVTPVRRLNDLTVHGARVVARRRDGRWDLLDVLRQSTDTTGGGGFTFHRLEVRDVAVAAELSPDSVARLRVAELSAREVVLGDTATLAMDALRLAVQPPGSDRWLSVTTRGSLTPEEIRLNPIRIHTESSELTGRVVLPRSFHEARLVDKLEVRLAGRPLDLRDLAALTPAVTPEGLLRFDANAEGRGNLVTAHLAASLDRGRVALDGGTELGAGRPLSYRVRGTIADVDPSRLLVVAPAGVVNATIEGEVDAPLSRANGHVRVDVQRSKLGATLVRRLDLRAVLTRGLADLTLRGTLDSGTVSATGRARLFDSVPTYRLSGTAHGLPGTSIVARALTGREGNPTLAVGFRLSGEGTSPDSASSRGRVELLAVRDTGARVSVGHATWKLSAGRLEISPEIRAGGGTITAIGRVTLGDTLAYELRQGRIDRVDLGQLVGDTVPAPLSGRFGLAGGGAGAGDAKASAHVHLDELRYGSRRLERVDLALRLDQGRLHLEGDGALQGGRLVLDAFGRPFDSTATYVLRRAALEGVDLGSLLGQPALEGPVTLAVAGEGRVRGDERSGRARLTLESSRLGQIEITGGRANLGLAGARLDFDAFVRTTGGEVSVVGEGAPLAQVPAYKIREGRLTNIDLGRLLARPGLSTDLNSMFTADVTYAAADSLQAGLGLVILPSRVNRAELTAGAVDVRMVGRSVEAKLRADGPDVALEASVHGAPAEERSTFTAGGSLRLEHLAHWLDRRDAEGRVESRFALTLQTDSAGFRTVGGTVDAVGGLGGVRVPMLHLAMTPADGELRVDTVSVRSNVASIDGGGRLQLRPDAARGAAAPSFTLSATLADMAPLAALMRADTVGFDSARATLALTGPARRWRIEGSAQADGVAFGGNLANRVTLSAGATLDSTRIRAVSADLRVKDAAYGQLSVRELRAVGGYDSTVALDLDLNIGDSVRVASRIRGTISTARDTVRAELERLTLDEGGRHWALERPARFGFGPSIEVDSLMLRAGDRSFALEGIFDRRGSSDLTLRVAALDLEALRASGLVPVGGRLDGSLHLSGPAADPRLQGKMSLAILSDRGQELGALGTDIDWTSGGLRVAAAARPRRGSALTVEGSLPYRLTLAPRDTTVTVSGEALEVDTVSLAVRADSFDLSLFQPLLPPDVATGIRGRLRTDARIGGGIRRPAATGAVSLTGAALELPSIDVAYERGELAGRLEGETLRIERLRLFTGKEQELTGSGSIGLRPLSDPALDLAAALQHFRLVDSDQLQTAASGRVQLKGTLAQPSLTGRLSLDKTNFFVGAAAAHGKVEQVELSPAELRELARDFGPSVLSHGKETPGLMDRVKLDLAIQMPRQVWIRRTSSPRTDIELMGSLRLTQQPGGEMQFFGRVEPVPERGTIELNGRQFRLTEGDINLAGPVDSTKLDVNASYQVPTQGGGEDEGVLINVHAKGRLDSLGLDFTSEPSLSQDDILSYIVTGRPTSDNPLFESQGGGGNTGEQIALGTLSSAISNAAGQGLGFDVFQIRQEPTRGLTLTAGRYLGSRLFLDLQLPLQVGSRSQQTPGSNLGPGFELEYTLERWLRANLRGGSLSPGLLLRARRAY
ncbi:MAG TPA: translocation/assembly module TamB [Gemmatimonadales bacterium]|nr:translocation/assembly module TamB [Gemmatimonadales bacterium]